MVRIAVLMACHNRKDKTLNCLKALFNQSDINNTFSIDVHLVDDKSTDGTEQAINECFPEVTIIKGNGNLFWNRGMYTAWEVASRNNFDFYLWLNDDTNPYDFAIKEMLTAAIATNNKAIICGSIESPEQNGELTYGGGKRVGNNYVSNYPNGEITICEIINGNCVLIPRYVYQMVGNLDWTFNHGIGDNDYSLRAKKLGILSYTTGSFVAACARNASLPKWCLPQVNLIDRIKNLYSPLGSHPFQFFIFEKRHLGILTATKHFFSIHLRVLIPQWWK